MPTATIDDIAPAPASGRASFSDIVSEAPQSHSAEQDEPKGPGALKLAPEPTPTAQDRFTRTPIAFGQTVNAPDDQSAFTSYADGDPKKYGRAQYGSGPASLIEANMGPDDVGNRRMLRHEAIHALLSGSPADYDKVLKDPVLQAVSKPIIKIIKANGYKEQDMQDLAHELPAYLGAFTTSGTDAKTKLPSEWTSGVTSGMRSAYVAAFTKALAKQDPETASKYQRMLQDTSPGTQAGSVNLQPGGLPHPDLVDQQTTAHAQTLAGIISQDQLRQTSQQMADQPPPVPGPALPEGLQSDDQVRANAPVWTNPRTGQRAKMLPPGQGGGPLNVLDNPITGANRAGEGVSQMAEPGLRNKAGGLHKVIGGTLEAATPLMVAAGAAAPLATAATLATGTAAQGGTEWALKKIGIPEEYAQVAGDLVGLFAAAKTPKTIAALKAKYEPVLKARFEKASAQPEASANSTGGEPYKPPAQTPPPVIQREVESDMEEARRRGGFGESMPGEAFRDAFGAEKPEADKPADKPPANPAPPSAASPAVAAAPEGKPADKPQPSGPTYLGSGFGAFEPFLRESFEDMRALKAQRDAALEELERSKITPGEKDWGGRVRHFFTGERDLWAARSNQGIAKVRKLTYQFRNRRTGVDTTAEAIAIAREFKGNTDELKSILGAYHPDLAAIQDPKIYQRVMDRIQALRPVIERALGKPDDAMKAVDQFYTNMATVTAAEGKRVGTLHSEWNPETYVPHVLHPKGEGQYPGLRKAIGSAMGGKIGKYFGFSQERSYPTLLHAIMHDVVPKTLNIHDAFTIQQDHFARSRATRLLEDQLRDTNVGKYVVSKLAPEGWKPLAPAAEEFKQLVPYDTGSVDDEGKAVLDTAEKRLYVPDFIADALKAITAPDFTVEIAGKDLIRSTQAATRAAQLGLSLFHATTENYMALANMGVKGWLRALAADRDSGAFLQGERMLIRAGGTTSIQGNTVEAYKALSPGSIPTYTEIWRKAPAVRQMDEAAQAISEFTFNNMQRRFKVTDFMLHRAAWMEKNPNAMQGELREAERGIAKEVNAIYGGLHWENIGVNKATVEISRALMLAPDWTISNIFNVKYAFEKGPAGSMARLFWARTLVGGMVATQAASLMFSRGHFSKRPTMVYMGKDKDGKEIYQNIFFKGAPGDATNLVTNIYDYGLEGIFRTLAGKGSPTVRTGLQLATNKDYLGHEIAPKGMNPLASSARTAWSAAKSLAPIPLSLTNQVDMLFGPESHKYSWPESLTTMFSGNPPSHVAPAGSRITKYGLRPNSVREENSALDQLETGQVYKSRNGR